MKAPSRAYIIACALWLVLGCDKLGCGPQSLAELEDQTGSVQRDFAAHEDTWSAAAIGARFDAGDGLRTGQNAHATLRISGGAKVLVDSDTTIRFKKSSADQAGRMNLRVSGGAATIQSGSGAFEISTELGLAVLQAGGTLRVHKGEHGQRYEVMVGRASFANPQGQQVDVAQGSSIDVAVGLAEIVAQPEATPAPAPVAPVIAPPDAGAPLAPAAAANTETLVVPVAERGADHADVVITAGNSISVYDPKPPTAIGFAFDQLCAHGASVRVDTGRRSKLARGHGQVNVLLPAGKHSYRVSCLDDDKAKVRAGSTGSVLVLRNAGTSRPPRSAPTNVIDLDGRPYTLMFQNLLPIIQGRWPSAPKARSYVIHASFDGHAIAQSSATPSYTFSSGQVPEGESRMYFESAEDPSQRSRETRVRVKFDNAAPTASLQKPPAAGFADPSAVQVEGVALPDSDVSVNGQALTLDAQHRFSALVPLPAGVTALAVRIDHRRTGVRYYLRRPLETR